MQPFPTASHRSHWNANDGEGEPVHAPAEAVSVEPRIAVPAIEGRPVFDGNVAMSAVAADVALAVPAALVAVTRTRSVPPTSAACRTYVAAVAPAMSTQFEPAASQRCH